MSVKIDLGCGTGKPDGYIGVDKVMYKGVDIAFDLNQGIPLPSDFADEVRANHVLEHLKHDGQVEIMTEIWRVLKDGGTLKIEIPSTDGRNAFLPVHTSFWNEMSFQFFIKGCEMNSLFNIEAQFTCVKLETTVDEDNQAAYVVAVLRAVKD